MSNLLDRLDRQIQECRDPLQKAEFLAERGCYLARIGKFEEANSILASIRGQYGSGDHVRLSIYIMLLEGIVSYFARLDSASHDRVRRAFAISTASRMSDLISITSAWMAHLDFEKCDYQSMSNSLRSALSEPESTPDTSILRAAIVLGDANRYIGRDEVSQIWYTIAHEKAIRLGDRAAVGAIMYNRVAFGLARVVSVSIARETNLHDEKLRMMEMEILSASSYQAGSRVVALTHLTDLCAARVAMCRQDWNKCKCLLERLERAVVLDELPVNKIVVLVDLIWCRLQLDEIDEIAQQVKEIDLNQGKLLDVDDQMQFLDRLCCIAHSLNVPDLLFQASKLKRDAVLRYLEEEQELSMVLSEFDEYAVKLGDGMWSLDQSRSRVKS